MGTQHSVIAPSSSARRVQCPRSTRLEAEFPEDDSSIEAKEGEAAHWAVSERLSDRVIDVGLIAPNGLPLTQEMCEGADLTYDYVAGLLQPFGLSPAQGHIERPVAIPRIHPQSWGTPDFWMWLPGWTLLLVDYKFGHRHVEVFENWQLVEYIAGVSDQRPVASVPDTAVRVIAAVVQPRSFHRDGPVREWRTNLGDLRALINRASNAAHEALGDDPRARTGKECRDCRGRHACPTLEAEAYAAADAARGVLPLVLPPAALGRELRILKQAQVTLDARIDGLEQQALDLMRRGTAVPGWGVVQEAGREQWKHDAKTIIALGQAFSLDLAKPAEALTPAQARKAGLDPTLVREMVTRQLTAAKLIEDDGSFARRIFG